ncbi:MULTISPECIES: DUF2784 domain-containing protein [Photobacterium]|jgi:hypothetical protein|uniref:DUF2784 domain-containing protein n=1 Tax=Photobacterium alginatilyticum TaxID=1775171 RepID=A0ABW9YDL3_9GAMM|nr:DUF2784 domain-containing protein [Photobacterium alginatilyticum]NBI51871.1 DUF2784 domain-containing protein [Photobacterium alginatilyticum]
MVYRILADLVVIFHLVFIVFALLGGLLVIWRGYLLLFHIPAALWVAVISFKGWICPLTPLENRLRHLAGGEGYSGGFVEHYLIPIIYPVGLRIDVQVVLGVVAVGINIAIYLLVYYCYMNRRAG